MVLTSKLKGAVTAGLVGLASLGGAKEARAGPILTMQYFDTNGVQVTNGILTNGVPYEIKLQLATTNTNVKSKQFRSGDWVVNVLTQYVGGISALVSSGSQDFFSGYTMDSSMNRVDFTLDGTMSLTDNHRSVLANAGPTNRVGYLEDLFFTPNVDTATPKQLFSFSNVQFYDTNGSNYNESVVNHSLPYWLDVPNEPFMTIVPGAVPEPGTFGLAALALGGAYACRRKIRKSIEAKHSRNTGRKL